MEPKMVLPGDEIAEAEGTIHISNVSEEYTEDIHDMYRLGDVIRAKVIQVKPSLQLTTAERDLGVVKALCSVCRGPLELRGKDLYCPRDERTEHRKLAADYADLRLSVPASELGGGTIAEKHRAPRGEGQDREGRDRLRTEIQQLREVVSALFNAVFEEGEEDWDSVPEKDEFNLYN